MSTKKNDRIDLQQHERLAVYGVRRFCSGSCWSGSNMPSSPARRSAAAGGWWEA